MRASEIINQLSNAITEVGEDVEVAFIMDVEKWHPPLMLHVFEVGAERPEKYGVTFRLTSSGQYAKQTAEGYRFQEVAARAWMNRKK